MPEYQRLVDSGAIIGIVQRTLNQVDERLVNHGLRVAHLVSHFLRAGGGYDRRRLRDICFLAMVHDIGAYKTDEISQMFRFETKNVWNHSIYGYLFIRHFSPLRELAPAILFHHADWALLRNCPGLSGEDVMLSQIFNIADRADIFYESGRTDSEEFLRFLDGGSGERFCPEAVRLVRGAGICRPSDAAVLQGADFPLTADHIPFSSGEIDSCLRMLIFSIDFRSHHTVTHTITTASISRELARLMRLDPEETERIVCGAMLHDLGKIGVPIEILEFPGRLGPREMAVMREHVNLTGDILGDGVDPRIREIALRHHEKLDGTGYPLGLRAEELTPSQRAVAVADIVSALCGTRSYKHAYPKEKVLGILELSSANHQIDAEIVGLMTDHFDEIMKAVSAECGPVLEAYNHIQEEYEDLMLRYAGEYATA